MSELMKDDNSQIENTQIDNTQIDNAQIDNAREVNTEEESPKKGITAGDFRKCMKSLCIISVLELIFAFLQMFFMSDAKSLIAVFPFLKRIIMSHFIYFTIYTLFEAVISVILYIVLPTIKMVLLFVFSSLEKEYKQAGIYRAICLIGVVLSPRAIEILNNGPKILALIGIPIWMIVLLSVPASPIFLAISAWYEFKGHRKIDQKLSGSSGKSWTYLWVFYCLLMVITYYGVASHYLKNTLG